MIPGPLLNIKSETVFSADMKKPFRPVIADTWCWSAIVGSVLLTHKPTLELSPSLLIEQLNFVCVCFLLPDVISIPGLSLLLCLASLFSACCTLSSCHFSLCLCAWAFSFCLLCLSCLLLLFSIRFTLQNRNWQMCIFITWRLKTPAEAWDTPSDFRRLCI